MHCDDRSPLALFLASVAALGCASAPAPKPNRPRANPALAVQSDIHRDPACASPTWDITYELDGRMMTTGTLIGFGDINEPIGPGKLTIRFADQNGSPAPGAAKLIAYEMTVAFDTDTAGLKIETRMKTQSGKDQCGVASGTLHNQKLRWEPCTYGPTNGVDLESWTPDNAAQGPGCITPYHSRGTITCVDDSLLASCSFGHLNEGKNEQNEVWNQPLNTFAFSPDLKTFEMRGEDGPTLKNQKPPPEGAVETADRAASYTWFNLNGVEIKREESCGCR